MLEQSEDVANQTGLDILEALFSLCPIQLDEARFWTNDKLTKVAEQTTSRCTIYRLLRVAFGLLTSIGYTSSLPKRLLPSSTSANIGLLPHNYQRSIVQIRSQTLV